MKYLLLSLLFLSSCSAIPERMNSSNMEETVHTVLMNNKRDFTNCYETKIKSKKEGGKVRLAFALKKSGVVKDLKIDLQKGTLNKNILNCLEKAISRIKFPTHDISPDPEFEQPFNFHLKK